jgi:hypothetical protein
LTITGEEKDLESTIEFLGGLGYERFGILGASFALYTAKHQDIVKALVLWNPIINYN